MWKFENLIKFCGVWYSAFPPFHDHVIILLFISTLSHPHLSIFLRRLSYLKIGVVRHQIWVNPNETRSIQVFLIFYFQLRPKNGRGEGVTGGRQVKVVNKYLKVSARIPSFNPLIYCTWCICGWLTRLLHALLLCPRRRVPPLHGRYNNNNDLSSIPFVFYSYSG